MAKRKPGAYLAVGNLLADGRAVFFTSDNRWSADASEAQVCEGDAVDALEARALATAPGLMADIQIVTAGSDGLPDHIKHRMQVTGPSVRTDLGYQAGDA